MIQTTICINQWGEKQMLFIRDTSFLSFLNYSIIKIIKIVKQTTHNKKINLYFAQN